MNDVEQPSNYPTWQWVIGALLIVPALVMLVAIIFPKARPVLKPWVVWVSSAVILLIVSAAAIGSESESCPNAEERAYSSEMAAISDDALFHLQGFTEQTGKVSNNVFVITDDLWTKETALHIAGIYDYISAVRDVSAPPSMRRIHDYNIRAVDAMDDGMREFVFGVDNLDGDAIARATNFVKEHGRLLEAATTAMKRFCE